MDRGHGDAERELRKLERKLKQEYEQAYKEMQEQAGKWLKQFEDADAKKLALVKAGELDHAEYMRWRSTQMFTKKEMDAITDQLAHSLTERNQIAANLINGSARSSFITNYNYGAYEVYQASGMNLNFFADESTIGRLLKDNPKLLPKTKVDIPKDLRWNKRKLSSAITQGILQGDDIPSIAKRLRQVTDMSRGASVRNARTMTTSAENGGRMASYEEAAEMGIEMQKTWVATVDDRTRDAHVELDGVTVNYDEPFENSIGKIMYPADPDADPENVYNCRCTLIATLKGHGRNLSGRSPSKSLGNMSYDEWKKEAMDRAEERKKAKS